MGKKKTPHEADGGAAGGSGGTAGASLTDVVSAIQTLAISVEKLAKNQSSMMKLLSEINVPKGEVSGSAKGLVGILSVPTALSGSTPEITLPTGGTVAAKPAGAPYDALADLLTRTVPTPPMYTDLVQQILGPQFQVLTEALTDRPGMSMTILVPEQYSDMSPDERSYKKYDMRTKLISYATGPNDFRLWCMQIVEQLKRGRNAAGSPISLQEQLSGRVTKPGSIPLNMAPLPTMATAFPN